MILQDIRKDIEKSFKDLPRIETMLYPNLNLSNQAKKSDFLSVLIENSDLTNLVESDDSSEGSPTLFTPQFDSAEGDQQVHQDALRNALNVISSRSKVVSTKTSKVSMDKMEKIRSKIGKALAANPTNLEVLRVQIEFILNTVMEMCMEQLEELDEEHTAYLNTDFTRMLIEMKTKLHEETVMRQLQESGSRDELEAASDNESLLDGSTTDRGSTARGDYDCDLIFDDEAKEIRKVNIDAGTYRARYEQLVESYWKCQRGVSESYNFGLIYLDCRKFKHAVVKKYEELIEKFQQHMVNDFDVMLMDRWRFNEKSRREIEADHGDDIAKNIEQMRLIASLNSEEVFALQEDRAKDVIARAKFLNRLQIGLSPDQLQKYHELHSFPRFLRITTFTQSQNIWETQRKIMERIGGKIGKINEKILGFSLRFDEFYDYKVYTIADIKEMAKGCAKSQFSKYQSMIKATERDTRIKCPHTGELYVWSEQSVIEAVDKMQILIEDIEKCQTKCATIQRHQELLGEDACAFETLNDLRSKKMPAITKSWSIIDRFNQKFFSWWTTEFPKLNIEELEECNMDWSHQINIIQKDDSFMESRNAQSFIYYIKQQLDGLKDFMNIIVALKTKGIEKRHFMRMERELSDLTKRPVVINPQKMNLKYLATQNLHQDGPVEIIKKYAAVAQKEHVIKQTLDNIDYDIDHCELNFVVYQETGSYIFDDVDNDLFLIRDCQMKIKAIETNPYHKYFEARVNQIGKEISNILEFFKNWKNITKHWAYLIPVFGQEDIQRVMVEKVDQFQRLNTKYDKIMRDAYFHSPITYQRFARLNIFPQESDDMARALDRLIYDINRYLILKRRNFPRLYLLSNEELMDMVGNSNDEVALQRDLIKLFPGIKKLDIEAPPEEHPEQKKGQKLLSLQVLDEPLSASTKKSLSSLNSAKTEAKLKNKRAPLKKRACSLLSKIIGIWNEQGEYLKLEKPVIMQSTLDAWCCGLEHEMQVSVSETIKNAFFEPNDDEKFQQWYQHPTQMCLVALDMKFSRTIQDIFIEEQDPRQDSSMAKENPTRKETASKAAAARELRAKIKSKAMVQNMKDTLSRVYKQTINHYHTLTQEIKKQMNDNDRCKISNIIINRIHVRDQIKNYQQHEFEYASDFLQQIQFKYQMEVVQNDWGFAHGHTGGASSKLTELSPQTIKIYAKVLHVDRAYGYEFLPNSARLVITPLTERVYQALFLAMYYDFGGAPYGPAGTGKTETIKDLAKKIGRNCFVYNCSVNMHISQIADLVTGVVACGYWSCFDEFNRIDLKVLQVLSEIFIQVNQCKQRNKTEQRGVHEIELQGSLVPFNADCGLFITLNPYSVGRSKLPTNLKNLFRIVSMITPDSSQIGHVVLMNKGFEKARMLSDKICKVFQLAVEQMAMQSHYDFGLRSVRSVLEQAGAMKHKALRLISDDQKAIQVAGTKLIEAVDRVKKLDRLPVRRKIVAKNNVQNRPTEAGTLRARMAIMKKMKTLQVDDDESSKVKPEEDEKGALPDRLATGEDIVREATPQEETPVPSQNTTQNVDEDCTGDVSEGKVRKEGGIDYAYIQNMIDPEDEHIRIETEEQLEEFVILKAIKDVQMPRLAFDDQQVFVNIVQDIFPNTPKPKMFDEIKLADTFASSPRMIEKSSKKTSGVTTAFPTARETDSLIRKELNFRLREVTEGKMTKMNIYCGEQFMVRAIQLYQSIQNRHGIMIVGAPVTGKTTLLKISKDVSKHLCKLEYARRQASFLKQKAFRMGIKYTEDGGEGKAGIRLEARDDPKIAKMFLPTDEEKMLIANTQEFFDVTCSQINPASMVYDKFFGVYNHENNDFKDGCLTRLFREANADKTSKLKLIVFDGPMEPTWVENLNSVLDDNRKLFFGNGESLPLSDKMRIVLETADLSRCSPATVSRCGVVYLEDHDDIIPIKSHVNSWIRALPPILYSEVDRFDQVLNAFIFVILDRNWLEDSCMIHPMSKKQCMKTLTQIMQAQLGEYALPKYEYPRWRDALVQYARPEHSFEWGSYVIEDEPSRKVEQNQTFSASALGDTYSSRITDNAPPPVKKRREKVIADESTPPYRQKGYAKSKFPSQKFADNEQLFINSIRFKTRWLHSFFLFAVIWSFGVNLNREAKIAFEQWFVSATTQSGRRQEAAEGSQGGCDEESDESYKPEHILVDDVDAGGGGFKVQPTDIFGGGNLKWLKSLLPSQCDIEGELARHPQKPDRWSIFDIYFDIEHDDWLHWDSLRQCCLYDPAIGLKLMDPAKKEPLFHHFWLTEDSIRYTYLLDRLISSGYNVLLVGPSGVGKTRLIRQYAKKGLKASNSHLVRRDYSMTGTCDVGSFQEFVMKELKKNKKNNTWRPYPSGTTQLIFIDDLNMCLPDKHGIKQAHELLRHWFDYQGVYLDQTKEFNQVKNIQFCCTVSLQEGTGNAASGLSQTGHAQLQDRLMWNFAVITHVNQGNKHLAEIYQSILQWEAQRPENATIQNEAQMKVVTSASIAFYQYLVDNLRPSPNSFTQRINQRHILSSLYGIIDCLLTKQDRKDEHIISKLLIHEMTRATLDRNLNEGNRKTNFRQLKKDVMNALQDTSPKKKQPSADRPMFSYIRKDQVNFYTRVRTSPDLEQDRKKESETFHEVLLAYNSLNFKTPIQLTLFDFVLDNIMKTIRSLRQPLPGTILLADEGCGADKIAKLSLMLSEYSGREFGASLKNFDKDKWIVDLKQVMHTISQELKPLVMHFEERDLHTDQVLSDLNALMAHGEMTVLLTPEEEEMIINRMRSNKGSNALVSDMKGQTEEHYLEEFRETCGFYIKVMMIFTPWSPIFRNTLRTYSHLLNCSTVIVMGDWGHTGLLLVARAVLGKEVLDVELPDSTADDPLILPNRKLVLEQMVAIYSDIQNLARRIFCLKRQTYYISPSHFTHFCKHYVMIYRQQEEKFAAMVHDFDKGLRGIRKTQEQIDGVQEKLSQQAPELVKKQHAIEEELILDRERKEEIEKTLRLMLLEEKDLDYQTREGRRVQEFCHQEFATVIPVLNKAVTGLQNLNKKDIEELRSLNNPPEVIKTLLKAVCLILKVQPIRTLIPGSLNQYREDYWTPSVGPSVLGAKNISQILGSIDPTNLDQEILNQIEEIMDGPNFSFIMVDRGSFAAKGLFMWVKAVRNFYYVYKMNEGYRDKMVIADLQAEKLEKLSIQQRKDIADLTKELQIFARKFSAKEEEIKRFTKQIDDCYIMKSRAARLIDALGNERHKWQTCKALAQRKQRNLEGDCIVAAALVVYLAPFDQKIRDFMKHKWSKWVFEARIPCTKHINFNAHFLSNTRIQTWIEKGLPNDSFSIQSAIIRQFIQIQTVILDPHQQARKFLMGLNPQMISLTMGTSKFLEKLKVYLAMGNTVIIENVGNQISRALYPLIKMGKLKKIIGKEYEVALDGKMVQVNFDFELLLSTVFGCPDFGAEINEHIIMVNFELTEQAFDAQIMSIIIQEVEQETETNMRVCKKQAFEWVSLIKKSETSILDTFRDLNADEMTSNEHLIEILHGSQKMQSQIGKSLKRIAVAQKALNKKKAEYAKLTKRATKLFFLVQEFSKLCPIYQFTHQWFFQVFLDVLKQQLAQDPKPSFDEIMLKFSHTFFCMVCQQIFDQDKLLFSFMLSYKTLEGDAGLDFRQVEFFIKGPLAAASKKGKGKQPKATENTNQTVQSTERSMLSPASDKVRPHPLGLKKRAPVTKQSKLSLNTGLAQMQANATTVTEPKQAQTTLSGVTPYHTSPTAQSHRSGELSAVKMAGSSRASGREKRIRREKDWQRRKDKCDWINAKQWQLIDKLSKIPPFDQKNDTNPSETLAEHVEKHPRDWFGFIYADRLEEQERQKRKRARPGPTTVDIGNVSEESETYVPSKKMPGGYEAFDYKIAHLQRQEDDRKGKALLKSAGVNLTRMMKGAAFDQEFARQEKELDDFFAKCRDTSDSGEDGECFSSGRDRGGRSELEDDSDAGVLNCITGQTQNRKNNLQDEMEIAEAIICGIAQYNEIDVKNVDDAQKVEVNQLKINKDILKLCVTRCFRPDQLMSDIKEFISKVLGAPFVAIPAQNFNTYVWPNTTRFRPILVVMGEGIDCSDELRLIKSRSRDCSKTGPEGLRIMPGGSNNGSKIARTILEAATQGHWVLLNNVHLCMDILPNLQQLIAQLATMHWDYSNALNREAAELQERFDVDEADYKGSRRLDEQAELDAALAAGDQQKAAQRRKDAAAMLEFPEGRANFAEDEQSLRRQHRKPSNMAEQVQSHYDKKKRRHQEHIRKQLVAIGGHIDDPDPSYESVGRDKSADEKTLEDMVLPDRWAFYIKSTFRLFISTLPLSSFPAGFARKCTKMSLELPTTVQRIAKKNLDSISRANFATVDGSGLFKDQYRKLLMSISILHAVVSRREQFGPYGWSKPGYEFSPNDFEIAVAQLVDLFKGMKPDQRMPVALLRHVVTYLNYGSVVTCKEDLDSLHEIVQTFIHADMFAVPDGEKNPYVYDLTGASLEGLTDNRIQVDTSYAAVQMEQACAGRGYKMPSRLYERLGMAEMIKSKLPEEDRIEVFGLTELAAYKSQGDNALELMNRMVVHQFVMPVPHSELLHVGSKDEQIAQVTQEDMEIQRYKVICKRIDFIYDSLEKIRPFDAIEPPRDNDYAEGSFYAFLSKEAKQYNKLMSFVDAQVIHTYEVLQGKKPEDEVATNTFEFIQSNRTPLDWLKQAYNSFRSCSTFTENLATRVNYLVKVIAQYSETVDREPLRKFQICYFYDQKAFLTTLIQTVSRKTGVSIENLKLTFRVMKKKEKMVDTQTAEMTNSYYIEGLYLNGAQWNDKHQTLDACAFSYQTSTELPLIHARVEVVDPSIQPKALVRKKKSKDRKEEQKKMEAEQKALKKAVEQMDALKQPEVPHYKCPCYVTSLRNRATVDQSIDHTMIIHIPLPTKFFSPAFWVRQNVAITCYSDEDDT